MALKLNTPTSFPAFPFEPYGIQLDLMQHLYSAIEDRKVTIIESPTGTGKTLSLLCASLTWLKDEQERARKGQLDALLKTKVDCILIGPDWVLEQTLERRRRELEGEDREKAERLAKARKKEAEMRKRARAHVRKKQKLVEEIQREDEGDFLPDDADEDRSDDEYGNLSPAVRTLMQKLQHGSRSGTNEEAEPVCTKIYYASRTHSQLAQVLHELRKLRMNLELTRPRIEDDNTGDEDVQSGSARTVSLASRKQLCINEDLRRRHGDIDEACRQLLNEKGKRRCPHLPPLEDEVRMIDLRDQILATPKDIEDLVGAGQNADVCPYFGSRKAIPQAQLVLLPYNLLLQKNAREALGVDLTNQVIIVDEAHNLTSTLLSLSTTRLPVRTLSSARQQLSVYLSRFRTRLSTDHALHLTRLMGLLDALQQYADEWRKIQDEASRKGQTSGHLSTDQKAGQRSSQQEVPKVGEPGKPRVQGVEVMTPSELLQRLGRKSEGVNLLEVERYLRSSRIARKISGYTAKALEKAAGEDPVKLAKVARLVTTTPPLHTVESFITSLTSANDDGRITISVADDLFEIKYQQLNPATHFQDVVDSARAVVLAGGTMSPISDVVQQLFSEVSVERLSTFSCGHIIPPTSLQTLVLKRGPRGGDLQFKFEQRGQKPLIAELGQILLNLVNIVPAGMVVFLPSYSFLNVVMAEWKNSGLVAKLNGKKRVFSEPQDSGEVDTVLREYSAAVRAVESQASTAGEGSRKGGALLFAVIGAKLSEGLNFTDDLARAVVIIGLPYANLASPELQERMKYVNRLQEQLAKANAPARPANGRKDAANELYENMCMNAVNQSIGRAIRHRNDWAALILVDCRYGSPRIREKLPQWIAKNAVVTETFGPAMKTLGNFYRGRRGDSKYCTMDLL
ncbi:DNA repair helicase [Rhodofomes roseus]|uniref:ATP-dependent DNA helicase CHL1 n=1 Tax=Rhodofomes roseus TaxID=34475 RepID=A0ABQ8K981_9APHY|nr:DNA repair helicase [Rhodofomes roseus]KAH9833515.1 DNA repair helicase [Rhodofomes roseus]